MDSPVPTPSMTRPGVRLARVAMAWATIDGWYRKVGATTLVPSKTRDVRRRASVCFLSIVALWGVEVNANLGGDDQGHPRRACRSDPNAKPSDHRRSSVS